MKLNKKNKGAALRSSPKKHVTATKAPTPEVRLCIVGTSNFLENWVKSNQAWVEYPVELMHEMLVPS